MNPEDHELICDVSSAFPGTDVGAGRPGAPTQCPKGEETIPLECRKESNLPKKFPRPYSSDNNFIKYYLTITYLVFNYYMI